MRGKCYQPMECRKYLFLWFLILNFYNGIRAFLSSVDSFFFFCLGKKASCRSFSLTLSSTEVKLKRKSGISWLLILFINTDLNTVPDWQMIPLQLLRRQCTVKGTELEHKLLQRVLKISCYFWLSCSLGIRSFCWLLVWLKRKTEMDGKALGRLH